MSHFEAARALQLGAIVAHLPIVLFATDSRGVFTLCEGRGLVGLGLTSTQLVGQNLFTLYGDNPPIVDAARRAIEGEELHLTVEVSGRSFDTHFFPLRDDRGKPSGISGVAIDVTDQRIMQARLLQAERSAALGTLAAGVAHEINNPLTYVALNLAALGRDLGALKSAATGEPSELRPSVVRAEESLRIARDGTDRIARIVRDLGLFSHANEDRTGATDARRVMDSALALAWNELRHRARVTKEYEDVPPVDADDARLGQVFLNLLLNAAQALPEGNAREHTVHVLIARAGTKVAIEVRDTGVGIPASVRSRIFDPFFTTRTVGSATGLGLSVCHGIVTGLGGEITVDSVEGRGTTFRVLLPAYDPAKTAERPSANRIRLASSPSTPRILVVDDEPLVADAIRRSLEPDVEVVSVLSGRDAIARLLHDQKFDVVLCDIMMPDIAGMDVYDAIRRARPGLEERFVFVTGGAFTSRARSFVASISNPCLEKPLDIDALRRLVVERL